MEGITSFLSEFKASILPQLTTFADVDERIKEFQRTWQDLFNFYETFRNDIVAFFTDPLEFLLARFTDWFLGPEE